MVAATDEAAAIAAGEGGVSLGKGAWDCDKNCEIAPEKEAEEFEEIATMDYPFEGIPTVPPRKDMDRMAFFCGGCRYRVTAYPDWSVEKVKQALWHGGIERSNKAPGQRNTPGLNSWTDLAVEMEMSDLCNEFESLIYAGDVMKDGDSLSDYGVPAGCKCLIAIETAKLFAEPEPGSAYWN